MLAPKRLYFTPEEYFTGLIQDIGQAQREIVLETYIYKLDDTGNKVLAALIDASARGVSLRLLVDGVGSYRDAGFVADWLKFENCEVRVFHPLPWDFSVYRRALQAGRWYSRIFYFLASINNRNHRKLCLIDQQIAWTGSFNITSDHSNLSSGSGDDYWHDTGIRITGPVVQTLATNFDQVWQQQAAGFSERSRRFLARVRGRRQQPELQLRELLEHCAQQIWITNAYFNPSNQILKLLKRKAKAGVSVQIIVPRRSDVVFFPLLSRSYYADLLSAGIHVFEYGRRVLHSKTMLADKQVLVGSTNLNHRSLFHDLELDLLLDDGELVSAMEQRFRDDISDCVEITLRKWQQHPWLDKLLGWFSRFLRYWL